jgi:hypothetical protein
MIFRVDSDMFVILADESEFLTFRIKSKFVCLREYVVKWAHDARLKDSSEEVQHDLSVALM